MGLARKPFVVLDAEILSSSVWSEAAHVRLVWITLLILCDTDGYVGAAVPGIARAAGVTLAEAREAIARFQQPDPDSRTQTNEGRRLAVAERGFRVLNFREHLDRLSSERTRARERMRKHRQRKGLNETPCNAPTRTSPAVSAQGIGNREQGPENRDQRSTETDLRPPAADVQVFDHWREVTGHPDAKFTAKRKRAVKERLREGYTVEQLRSAVDGCRASPFHQGENERRTVYDDLELICRSGEKVEQFIAALTVTNHAPPASAKMREAQARSKASMLGGLKGDGSVVVGGLGTVEGLLPGSGPGRNGRADTEPDLPQAPRLPDGAPVGARGR